MNIISINRLFFSYKTDQIDVAVFKDFNLDVQKGDFVAIKGPSGSGKSTLLYLIAGLLKGNSGTIYFEGRDLKKLSDIELSVIRNKQMAFVFQQFHLLPKTTVLDNILIPASYPVELKQDKMQSVQKALKIAKDLGIDDRLDHFPNQLSGGQQQRVAIARALINDADLILADEPTGNLDSSATSQIMSLFKDLNTKGKTIILITHDDEVASYASSIYHLKDGNIQDMKSDFQLKMIPNHTPQLTSSLDFKKTIFLSRYVTRYLTRYLKLLPISLSNAFRNKTRSILTMLGITVGVAAVCSMVTLGNFTKKKILDSYSELGVNTIEFSGFPNWELSATDQYPLKFQSFDWQEDILPLKTIFPQIKLLSPHLLEWNISATFGGKSVDKNIQLVGVSEEGLNLLNMKLAQGKGINYYHVINRNSVCVIGHDIAQRLFKNMSAIGHVIYLAQNQSAFVCEVIGVLEPRSTSSEWLKPNMQVFIPFTLYSNIIENLWSSRITNVMIQFFKGVDVEKYGKGVQTFFEQKYGISGRFHVGSDGVLVAQMRKFLILFSILLTAIAIVTLIVGGMGITNMMLVSVSERLKEIGIRKSVGATDFSIKYQFIFESMILCSIAGLIGIVIGIGVYQGAIWGASKLISKLAFEWIFDPFALLLSFISIFTVGVLSGLAPARKAQKLSVVDALRSE